jgi:hypothetical protein
VISVGGWWANVVIGDGVHHHHCPPSSPLPTITTHHHQPVATNTINTTTHRHCPQVRATRLQLNAFDTLKM